MPTLRIGVFCATYLITIEYHHSYGLHGHRTYRAHGQWIETGLPVPQICIAIVQPSSVWAACTPMRAVHAYSMYTYR